MNMIAKLLFTSVTAAALYTIISKWWVLAEVKLYGWSQISAVDTLAASIITVIAAVAISMWVWPD